MTLDEFIKKYDGKTIDYDGKYGGQCVDLYRQYVKEVLGFPQSPPVEGAKDIWNTYLPEYFGRVENTPSGVPEKGDIVIFGTGIGKYGHVSIFVEGDVNRFTSFDQNYPTGTPCHLQGHTYSAVLGWLKPLKKAMEIPAWFKTLLEERGLSLDREGEFRAFWEKAIKYDDTVRELQEQVKSANEALSDRSLEVSALTEKNQKLSDKVDELTKNYNDIKDERDRYLTEKNQLSSKLESLQKDMDRLLNDIDVLQQENTRLKSDLVKSQRDNIKDYSLLKFILLKLRR